MKDITNKEDIKLLIDTFYAKALKDEILAPIFDASIPKGTLMHHLKRITNFWNTVLFMEGDYRGNPFSVHTKLPLEAKHFEQWLALFHETVDQYFKGNRADEIKLRATRMGMVFQVKLQSIRNNPTYKSIM